MSSAARLSSHGGHGDLRRQTQSHKRVSVDPDMNPKPPRTSTAAAAAAAADTSSSASSRHQEGSSGGRSSGVHASFGDPAASGTTSNSSSSTSHKRTASGNPRPLTRMMDERRRTERSTVTHLETLVKRSYSPERPARTERRSAPADKKAAAETRTREARAETPQAPPWCPEASLLPHTTAPLASRITAPPLASQTPASLQPKALHDLTLDMQEAAILEDLLFVLMGYEGQYIRYSKGFNPTEERDRLQGPAFKILPGLDPSLQDLAQSMLKMATYYSAVEAGVDVLSRAEYGAVNHALCAAIRKYQHDYLVLITQLENQFLTDESFTVHVLNIHTLTTTKMMFQLYALVHELLKRNGLLDDDGDESSDDDSADDFENILESLREGGELGPGNMTGKKICKGGVVLGIITKRLEVMSGDPVARELLTSLLRDASRPYMTMLNEWLHHGGINDPHAEFLVKEQKSIRRERLEQDYTDDYWEKRYIMREHDVPPQLEGVRDKVLLAGKYLNVVRECGGVDVSKEVKDVPKSFDDPRFLENVNSAYAHANQSLLQLLLTTHALPARLRSLKHYFFLDPSDYFSYFLELGASELRKPIKAVNTGKLQSLLDLVLRQPGSLVSLDPFKEDVKVEMNDVTLTKSLQRVVNITGIEQGEVLQPLTNQPVENDKNATGFTSLQLDYLVPFPVSLVIGRKTIWRYQALFRYLLSLRHLESQLSMTWQTHTRGTVWSHRSTSRPLDIWKRRVWTLRARMLVFVQQLLYYCTAEVIEPNWQRFMSTLKTTDSASASSTSTGSGADAAAAPAAKPAGPTRTVDELMQDHVDFLDTCLKECMMTNSKLLRIHSKLMQTCTIFAAYTNRLSRELEKADPDLSGPTKPSAMSEDEWRRFQGVRAHNQARQQQAAAANADTSTASAGGSSSDVAPEARVASLLEIIHKWESNFSRHLQILLDALNHYAATETVVLLSLCARLSTANQGTEYAGLRHDEDMLAA